MSLRFQATPYFSVGYNNNGNRLVNGQWYTGIPQMKYEIYNIENSELQKLLESIENKIIIK
jgi:hypothetical protein